MHPCYARIQNDLTRKSQICSIVFCCCLNLWQSRLESSMNKGEQQLTRRKNSRNVLLVQRRYVWFAELHLIVLPAKLFKGLVAKFVCSRNGLEIPFYLPGYAIAWRLIPRQRSGAGELRKEGCQRSSRVTCHTRHNSVAKLPKKSSQSNRDGVKLSSSSQHCTTCVVAD